MLAGEALRICFREHTVQEGKSMKRLLFVALILGSGAAMAVAAPVLTGVYEGDSWYVQGYDTGYDSISFEMFAIELVSTNATFEFPTWRNMPGGWWNVDAVNTDTVAVAMGPTHTGALGSGSDLWRIYFEDLFPSPESVVFNWYTFGASDEAIGAYHITVNSPPNGWSVVEFTSDRYRSDFIPVPALGAAPLGVIGLGAIVWLRRRFLQ